jgi:hypothetical protein
VFGLKRNEKCHNFGNSGWQLLFYLQSVLTRFTLEKYSTNYFLKKRAVKFTGHSVICSRLWGTLDKLNGLRETVKKAQNFGEI